jgi:hypothetical protein
MVMCLLEHRQRGLDDESYTLLRLAEIVLIAAGDGVLDVSDRPSSMYLDVMREEWVEWAEDGYDRSEFRAPLAALNGSIFSVPEEIPPRPIDQMPVEIRLKIADILEHELARTDEGPAYICEVLQRVARLGCSAPVLSNRISEMLDSGSDFAAGELPYFKIMRRKVQICAYRTLVCLGVGVSEQRRDNLLRATLRGEWGEQLEDWLRKRPIYEVRGASSYRTGYAVDGRTVEEILDDVDDFQQGWVYGLSNAATVPGTPVLPSDDPYTWDIEHLAYNHGWIGGWPQMRALWSRPDAMFIGSPVDLAVRLQQLGVDKVEVKQLESGGALANDQNDPGCFTVVERRRLRLAASLWGSAGVGEDKAKRPSSINKESLACAYLIAHATASKAEIAKHIGCSPTVMSTPGRWKEFKKLWDAMQQRLSTKLPDGAKHSDGSIEAHSDEE